MLLGVLLAGCYIPGHAVHRRCPLHPDGPGPVCVACGRVAVRERYIQKSLELKLAESSRDGFRKGEAIRTQSILLGVDIHEESRSNVPGTLPPDSIPGNDMLSIASVACGTEKKAWLVPDIKSIHEFSNYPQVLLNI